LRVGEKGEEEGGPGKNHMLELGGEIPRKERRCTDFGEEDAEMGEKRPAFIEWRGGTDLIYHEASYKAKKVAP